MSNENDCVLTDGIRDTDVLTFNNNGTESSYKFKYFKTIFIPRLKEVTNSSLSNRWLNNLNISEGEWIGEGIPCELLQDGIEKKGKIRLKVTVEFVPDEVEVSDNSLIDGQSPLDDIRQINL